MAAIGAAGFIPNSWICDLASQFKLVYVVLLAILLVLSAVARARIVAAILCGCLLVTAIPVVRMMPHPDCQLPIDRQNISILNFNTEFLYNNRYDLVEQLIEQRHPDIIALVEINKKWIDCIQKALKPYRYSKVVLAAPGMAVYSLYPIENIDVRYYAGHPRIFMTVKVGTQSIHLLIAHPTTPMSQMGFEERNREFAQLSDEIRSLPRPKMLIGDMNCGPWSPAFRKLLRSGLHDSEQGFGPQPSWPARTGRVFPNVPIPPLIPIDHVLVSEDFCVLQRTAGPPMNSDHLPVFVTLTMPK